jgi:Ca2+-binding EF-hand superfamily protein
VTQYWKELFTAPRGTNCQATQVKKEVTSAAVQPRETLINSSNKDFGWVKKWGYGPVAYLFDYLDVILQKDMSAAFLKLFTEARKFSNLSTKKNRDPFRKMKVKNKAVWEVSVNTVQIRQLMKEFNWPIENTSNEDNGVDFATEFVRKYDMDNDGRLNARELTLGAILHNKDSYKADCCHNCFQSLGKKLDAIFVFFDCNNDGVISAEDLWNSLPKLKRRTKKYDIFAVNNKDNIRTSAINDFILKNGVDGKVTREGFRMGLLFGYWDRQTRETGVLLDDSRNLKKLRWTDRGLRDSVAFNLMKQREVDRLVEKNKKNNKKN